MPILLNYSLSATIGNYKQLKKLALFVFISYGSVRWVGRVRNMVGRVAILGLKKLAFYIFISYMRCSL